MELTNRIIASASRISDGESAVEHVDYHGHGRSDQNVPIAVGPHLLVGGCDETKDAGRRSAPI
jgi:hypothetical protein